MLPRYNQNSNRWETSTHRTRDLTPAQIWKLGYDHVENVANKRVIKGRGQGAYALATAQELTLDVNGAPFPRHVDIVGWSQHKDVRLMIATEIADKLSLEVDPRT